MLVTTTQNMVDSNLVMRLEQEGNSYKDAYRIAFLYEMEDVTLKEAKRRVAEENKAKEKTLFDKVKEENLEKSLYPEKTGLSEETGEKEDEDKPYVSEPNPKKSKDKTAK
jgi:hypothetical protein